MEIIIKGFKCENLRIPDMEVELSDKVNFLQIPNGGGKTTLIELIQATLSDDWIEFKNNQASPPLELQDLANNTTHPKHGLFSLDIVWTDSDGKQHDYRFENNFNFDGNVNTKKTYSAQGEKPGYKPPLELRPLFSRSHVNVFLFKGEDVRHYFKSGAALKTTLDSFTGVTRLEACLKELDDLFIVKNKKSTKSKTTMLDKRMKIILTTQTKLKKYEDSLNADLKKDKDEWTKLDKKINNLDGNQKVLFSQQEDYEKKLKELMVKIYEAENKLSLRLRNPYVFSDILANATKNFLTGLQKKKLPGHASEFFVEVADGDHCICGEKITPSRKKEILSRKSDYLGQDHTDVVNKMKNESENNISDKDKYPINDVLTDLANLEEEKQEINQKIEEIKKANIKASLSTTEVKKYDKLGDNISSFEKKLEVLNKAQNSRSKLKTLSNDEIKNIESLIDCKRLIEHYADKIAKAQGFAAEKSNKDEFELLVKSAIDNASKIIGAELTEDVNSKISRTLPKNFRVESIKNKIKIQGKPSGGSMGQNASTVTAFTTSLLGRTGASYPLIIDHPVMTIQLENRSDLSKHMVESSSQVIALVINAEKDGFVFKPGTKDLHPYLKDAKFITVSPTDQGVDVKNIPNSNDTTQSSNGLVSYNKAFFKSFVTEKLRGVKD